jgi:hypothetical protein
MRLVLTQVRQEAKHLEPKMAASVVEIGRLSVAERPVAALRSFTATAALQRLLSVMAAP